MGVQIVTRVQLTPAKLPRYFSTSSPPRHLSTAQLHKKLMDPLLSQNLILLFFPSSLFLSPNTLYIPLQPLSLLTKLKHTHPNLPPAPPIHSPNTPLLSLSNSSMEFEKQQHSSVSLKHKLKLILASCCNFSDSDEDDIKKNLEHSDKSHTLSAWLKSELPSIKVISAKIFAGKLGRNRRANSVEFGYDPLSLSLIHI